jgi:hypothetical protein
MAFDLHLSQTDAMLCHNRTQTVSRVRPAYSIPSFLIR